jgi:hypothetical protein
MMQNGRIRGVNGGLNGEVLLWRSARIAAIAISSARAAAISFSAAKCFLNSWLYCVQNGYGRRLFGGWAMIWVKVVAPAIGHVG